MEEFAQMTGALRADRQGVVGEGLTLIEAITAVFARVRVRRHREKPSFAPGRAMNGRLTD
jgi:hypothetical protein